MRTIFSLVACGERRARHSSGQCDWKTNPNRIDFHRFTTAAPASGGPGVWRNRVTSVHVCKVVDKKIREWYYLTVYLFSLSTEK